MVLDILSRSQCFHFCLKHPRSLSCEGMGFSDSSLSAQTTPVRTVQRFSMYEDGSCTHTSDSRCTSSSCVDSPPRTFTELRGSSGFVVILAVALRVVGRREVILDRHHLTYVYEELRSEVASVVCYAFHRRAIVQYP